MQPLIPLMAKSPLTAIAIVTFPAAALFAALVLIRDRDLRRDFGYLAATAAFVSAFVTTLAAIKAYSYATWLGMPLVAAFALHLFAALKLQSLVPRFAVGMLLDAGGAVDRGDQHRQCGRPRRPRDLQSPRARGVPEDRKLRAAREPAERPDRRRHRFRPVPAGAHAAFGAGRAVSPALVRDRRGA